MLRGKPAGWPRRCHAFLELFQHVSRQVDITGLERVPEESDHPLEVYDIESTMSACFTS